MVYKSGILYHCPIGHSQLIQLPGETDLIRPIINTIEKCHRYVYWWNYGETCGEKRFVNFKSLLNMNAIFFRFVFPFLQGIFPILQWIFLKSGFGYFCFDTKYSKNAHWSREYGELICTLCKENWHSCEKHVAIPFLLESTYNMNIILHSPRTLAKKTMG